MLKEFISKKILLIYLVCISITWLEAIINPSIVSMVIRSFEHQKLETLWYALALGIIGNIILLIGLSGKRYFYAKLIAFFNFKLKKKIFYQFLYSDSIATNDILSDLENDIKQLEDNCIEPSVIILSSLGFTIVSAIYALCTNFLLGLIFILFYSIPALCSGIGSTKLDLISMQKSKINQSYLSKLTNIIGGARIIKNYHGEEFFYEKFSQELHNNIKQNINYEKQRTINISIVNGIDAFCSVFPIIIGGFMTFYGKLSGANFVAIYLVSYNISYQFQDLSYYINTFKSSKNLRQKYQQIFDIPTIDIMRSHNDLFPIQLKNINLTFDNKVIFSNFSYQITSGQKIAVIGPSGCGKSTLLNIIYGEMLPDSGQVLFNGKSLQKQQIIQSTAYILQDSYCFNELTLEENIALNKTFDVDKMDKILNLVNITYLKGKIINPNKISGGEKQRIEIARSLYHDSNLILADEVKSNLDKTNAKQIEEILLAIPQTVIEVIHHYTDETLNHYDQVIDLSRKNS